LGPHPPRYAGATAADWQAVAEDWQVVSQDLGNVLVKLLPRITKLAPTEQTDDPVFFIRVGGVLVRVEMVDGEPRAYKVEMGSDDPYLSLPITEARRE
jgi:hypothetical protein